MAESHRRSVRVDLVVKFGGSAITDKTSLETARKGQLAAAVRCVSRCVKAGLTCIVVHGAGSYGHHQAREYQVNSGLTAAQSKQDKDRKLYGYCLTRQSVTKLNQLVVDSLIQAGIPAIACSPGSSWELDDRRPVRWPAGAVVKFLQLGLVPVFHGDCCVDDSLGCCILSGDTIIQTLCSYFDVQRVVFLTDVDGIYDKPPDQPGASLLPTIQVNEEGEVKEVISASQSQYDVTGGILLKLTTAVEIVRHSKGSCLVQVCRVDSPQAVSVCLGTDLTGVNNFTTICFQTNSKTDLS